MRFAYYDSLSKANQRIYRASDAVEKVPIPEPGAVEEAIATVAEALPKARRGRVTEALQQLADTLNDQLGIDRCDVRVLSKRPSKDWGELHGQYETKDDTGPARITVWMRTAQRKQIVAFKSFFRTFLHEWAHHLDYEHLELADSFHTRGFYQRESNLFRQLVPDPARLAGSAARSATDAEPAPRRARRRSSSARSASTDSRSESEAKSPPRAKNPRENVDNWTQTQLPF